MTKIDTNHESRVVMFLLDALDWRRRAGSRSGSRRLLQSHDGPANILG